MSAELVLPRMGETFERCAYCGTDHDVCHIMYPEGWPLCSRCERANGAELLRAEIYAEGSGLSEPKGHKGTQLPMFGNGTA